MKKLILILAFLFLSELSFSQSWVQTLNGIAMWSMAKDLQGNVYAGTSGTTKALYKTSNLGINWVTLIPNGVTNFLSIAVDSLGVIYTANVSNGLLKSADGGNNWTTIPVSTFGGKNVQAVECVNNKTVLVGTISGGIFRSTDFGVTYPDTALAGATIVTLKVDKYNSNIVYAGASSTSGTTGFFISTNAGFSFTGPYNTNTCWGIMQTSPNILYMITTSSGSPFSMSSNGGYNWTTISSQPGSMRGCTNFNPNNLVICGNGGVFISTNSGASFTNMGLTSSGNQVVGIGGKLFAAMTGSTTGGVWIYTDVTNINPIGNETADKYELNQNYPNPFNNSTQISFSIPKDDFVQIKIFDIAGREYETLLNKNLKAGKYSFMYDAKNISSGIYFIQMIAGNNFYNRRIVLLK